MTEQDYLDITAACDKLLRAPGTTLARLAIPMLHVISEHAGLLAQYTPLLNGRWVRRSADFPRAVLRASRAVARSVRPSRPLPLFQPPIDVVLVSHLSSPAQLQQEHDIYFGSLQSLLQERQITSLLVLIDHLPAAVRARRGSSFPAPRMLLPRLVSPAQEINIWRACLVASRRLRRLAESLESPFERRVATLASREALSASAALNMRLHLSLCKLFQSLNPKMVITTYEGEAAERLIWHAARTAQRRPLCVGYQHARLLKHAHAIRRRVGVEGIDCDPDIVLTSGKIPHAALAASPGIRSMRLIELGSQRRAPQPTATQPRGQSRQCLVLPDADERECVTLFDFALACARQRPDLSFRLRPHPIVDTRLLVRRNPVLQQLPRNVSLSENEPLAQDLAQARYCLYRGSSAVIQAVVAGIKPFYLARPGELPFDPLHELTEWRETVQSPEDLITRMSLPAHTDEELAAAGRARSLCERYVSPLRKDALEELLAMVSQ